MWKSVAISLLLLVALAASAQVRKVGDGDLYLQIIPDRVELHPSDMLRLKVEVVNVGRDPIHFLPNDLCLNPDAGLTLRVTDADGHEVKISLPLTCTKSSEAEGVESFVRIEPDAFYGRMLRLHADRLFSKPGIYGLEFTLHGTVTRADASKIFPSKRPPAVVFSNDSFPPTAKFRVQFMP
jgi:hypothetical protein